MIKIKASVTFLFLWMFFISNPVFAGFFGEPESSPILMHLAGTVKIMGKDARPGDEVGVFDKRGMLIGVFVVDKAGIFGDMAISGDSGLTDAIEGASEEEMLEIRVWQKSMDKEYSGNWITVHRPEAGKGIYSPYTEPELRFRGGNFYLLIIEAE